MASIIAQIEDIEKKIERCERQLDEIERKGRLTDMSEEKWQEMRSEKKLLEKQIKNYRTELRGLRWQNWKTMVTSICLFGVLYVGYIVLFDTSEPSPL